MVNLSEVVAEGRTQASHIPSTVIEPHPTQVCVSDSVCLYLYVSVCMSLFLCICVCLSVCLTVWFFCFVSVLLVCFVQDLNQQSGQVLAL